MDLRASFTYLETTVTTFEDGITLKFSNNVIIPLSPIIHCFPLLHSDYYRMLGNGLSTFTEESLNGKFNFLCNDGTKLIHEIT